jgi:CRISPR-associated protein Csd1
MFYYIWRRPLGSENNAKRLAGTMVVYWYLGDVRDDEDPLTELFTGYSFGQNEVEPSNDGIPSNTQQRHRQQAESRAAKLLDTIRSGDEDALRLRNARYCALTLSGNSGRVVIRDWMEGAFEQLVERVSLWFDCLSLQNITGNGAINTPPIERLITCLLPDQKPGQDYAEWIKPIGPRRYLIWQCVLRGPNVAMMESIARSVLLQLRSAMLSGEINEAIDEKASNRKTRLASWYARLSLLKTYCIAIGDKEVNAYLNESHPHPAYHCGRLVATCQHIQSTAIGEPKAGVLDKFYASASTSPSLVIPRIWRTSLHHLRTIRNANPSLADDLWNLLREIHAQIRDAIPLMLSLHEQSLFQLGFFHQQAFLPTEKTVKRYRTKKGILVRSKSEVIIAHLLDDLGIVYSYEEELQIDGIIQPALLPDFTIHLGSDKPPIFIEHLGMLSRPAYKARWEQKLCTYRQIGIDLLDSGGGPNGSLFTTTEEEIEDLAKLKARIESCLRS